MKITYEPKEAAVYYKPRFGILKGVKQRDYGSYMWGEYKGKKIEVFDAWKHKQLLIYVSENMRFIKSKLVYWIDGIKKVMKAEGSINAKND